MFKFMSMLLSILMLFSIVASSMAQDDDQLEWRTYSDGIFSLQYPAGWSLNVSEQGDLTITNDFEEESFNTVHPDRILILVATTANNPPDEFNFGVDSPSLEYSAGYFTGIDLAFEIINKYLSNQEVDFEITAVIPTTFLGYNGLKTVIEFSPALYRMTLVSVQTDLGNLVSYEIQEGENVVDDYQNIIDQILASVEYNDYLFERE